MYVNKKKILFVTESFYLNGANVSMINLLKTLDYSRYEVDLFAFIQRGNLIKQIPSKVKLLDEDEFAVGYKLKIIEAIIQGCPKVKMIRIIAALINIISKKKAEIIKKRLLNNIKVINGEYDLAIGYCEGNTHRFVLDKVKSRIKAGWIHIDAGFLDDISNEMYNVLNQLNVCVAVSKQGRESLKKKYKINNIIVLYNILDYDKMIEMSESHDNNWYSNNYRILTIARLVKQKRIDIAIETAAILKKDGYAFEWRIVGEGTLYEELNKLIRQYKLEKNIVLMGMRDNPYIELRCCDIYVQTSEFEGRSIAVDEARFFCKPIVVTNIPSFKDQVINNENGILAELSADSFAKAIEYLIDNPTVRQQFSQSLKVNGEKEVRKDYLSTIFESSDSFMRE